MIQKIKKAFCTYTIACVLILITFLSFVVLQVTRSDYFSPMNETVLFDQILFCALLGALLDVFLQNMELYKEDKRERKRQIVYHTLSAFLSVLWFIVVYVGKVKIFNTGMLYLPFGMALLQFTPFMYAEKRAESFTKCVSLLLLSATLSVCLFFALNAIVMAFVALFQIQVEGYVNTLYLSNFSFILFMPLYFLANLEECFVHKQGKGIFRKILLNIFLPLFYLYIAVLTLYILKIIITWDMPSGIMNGAGLGALLLYAFFYLCIQGEENKSTAFFKKYGAFFMLPIYIVQQTGVLIRIHAYGWTEVRIVCEILSGVLMIFASFCMYKKRPLYFFPVCALVCMLLALPFLSPQTLAHKNQENRLYKALKRNHMLTENNMVIKNKNVPLEDQKIILDSTAYLKNKDKMASPFFDGFRKLQAQDENFYGFEQKQKNYFAARAKDNVWNIENCLTISPFSEWTNYKKAYFVEIEGKKFNVLPLFFASNFDTGVLRQTEFELDAHTKLFIEKVYFQRENQAFSARVTGYVVTH